MGECRAAPNIVLPPIEGVFSRTRCELTELKIVIFTPQDNEKQQSFQSPRKSRVKGDLPYWWVAAAWIFPSEARQLDSLQ